MVERQDEQKAPIAKIAMDPSQMIGRFRSKKDIYEYVTQHCKFLFMRGV